MDLDSIPFFDHHAHPLARMQPENRCTLRQNFTEAHDSSLAADHVGGAVYFRWTMHQLGKVLGVADDEDSILQARRAQPLGEYARHLVEVANVGCLLIDTGYPPPSEAYTRDEMEAMLRIPVRRMLRIEVLVQNLILARQTFSQVVEGFDEALQDIRKEGYVALKSIAAYRSGLEIGAVRESEAAKAFEPVRLEARREGAVRLTSKTLIDFFVCRALLHAARQDVPVQFHTGYGDPDLDLRLANPLHLRPIFENERFAGVPIILLHESYPFTAEAAFLASVYPNAYLDLAFSLPPLGLAEYRRVTGIALGVAPTSKIMCSSDGTRVPEHYYLGAIRARQVLNDVLTGMVAGGELDADEAQRFAGDMLWNNAVRVYRFSSQGMGKSD